MNVKGETTMSVRETFEDESKSIATTINESLLNLLIKRWSSLWWLLKS